MENATITKIVIAGGGTAGWMVAAALAKLHKHPNIDIKLIESESIGTVGVGEATIPHIQYFNQLLGLDERAFLTKTNATFKLGIEFVNWGKQGDSYFHTFGPYGQAMDGLHFHHFWLRHARSESGAVLDDFNLQALAAKQGKFCHPQRKMQGSPLSTIEYAFQFDATLYAQFMREFAVSLGVERIEGKITHVNQRASDGFVESLALEDGHVVDGQLFIDCTGFRGLLIEETLKTGYDDWSAFLPCDRAVARTCEMVGPPVPFTRATAHEAGWQWRIPLQNRTGNGHVYSSAFVDDDAALNTLNTHLDAKPISEPKFLRFKTGIRKKTWNKNVVAMGLAAGFLEPLESTSIHLVQTAIARLMTNFPDLHFNPHDTHYFNERTQAEYEQVRDFLILHYKATQRDDSPFWRYCRDMEIPDSLAQRMNVYAENGRLYRHDNELFGENSWFSVLDGQNITPKRYHPLVDNMSDEALSHRMDELKRVTGKCLDAFKDHDVYLKTARESAALR